MKNRGIQALIVAALAAVVTIVSFTVDPRMPATIRFAFTAEPTDYS
jgi:hypothetical protein